MQSSGRSIYNGHANIQGAYERLQADESILPENKATIMKFTNTWLAKGYTKSRAVKLVYSLRKLAPLLNKPFAEATKDDLIGLVAQIEEFKLAETTRYDFKVVLKTFYRWLKGDDEIMPREVSWIKPRIKNRSNKLPEELLTETDVLALANAAITPLDKAFVLVLYESGCRIGELLTLKLKNVTFDQFGAVLRVSGKTGDRRVRIISSAPALTAWLGIYEGAHDPEAYLWPPRSNNNHDTHYSACHGSVIKKLQVLAEKAGVKKRVHPHIFRHSRATALANKLTEAQMKEYFGWTQSSDMASVYVHLSGRDVDDSLLALQGFARPKEQTEEKLKLTFCLRCQEKNAPTAKFCLRCGTPMQTHIAAKVEEQQKNANELLNQLMQNAEFKEYMLKKVVELGLSPTSN